MSQLDLFGGEPEAEPSTLQGGQALCFDAAAALAEQLPPELHFGTSSWTFEGWSGIVYPQGTSQRALRERGLELYCRHPLLRTVGVDSSYYRPLEAKQLRRYAEQLPRGFRCVSKVFREITTYADPRSHALNPRFLNVSVFEEQVVRPLADSFAEHQGPLVLEFPPLRHPYWLAPEEFCERLEHFFSHASRAFPLAVELRNAELLGPRYAELLQRHGVDHVFNFWEQMPGLLRQLEIVGHVAQFGIARLLIPPRHRYSTRKKQLEPFDQIVDVQQEMRQEVLQLVRYWLSQSKPALVIVNNKAEGCSPLTISALAELYVKQSGLADGQ